jgi:transcriptional regulator with XRE-family HTH domain
VLSVEDWAEVRWLRRAERMSISEIARVLGISRNTVRAALASDAPPKYERKSAGSIADVVEPRIHELPVAAWRRCSRQASRRESWLVGQVLRRDAKSA